MEWDEEIYRKVLIEEGREEGREEGMLEIARRLKNEGAEVALIAKVSGLTEQEIDTL